MEVAEEIISLLMAWDARKRGRHSPAGPLPSVRMSVSIGVNGIGTL